MTQLCRSGFQFISRHHSINVIPRKSPPILGNFPSTEIIAKDHSPQRRNSRLHGTPRWTLPNFQDAHARHITFFISSSRCRPAEHVVQTVQQRFLTRPCYPYTLSVFSEPQLVQHQHGINDISRTDIHLPYSVIPPTKSLRRPTRPHVLQSQPPKSSKPTRISQSHHPPSEIQTPPLATQI